MFWFMGSCYSNIGYMIFLLLFPCHVDVAGPKLEMSVCSTGELGRQTARIM